jgi:transcriptional regulator with XRE-family HTH domain
MALTKSEKKLQVERFIQSLNQLMITQKLSQRKASDKIEITIGTMTKYLRGEVNPFDVKTRITRNLARELGMTPEALYSFYETGDYKDDLTISDVVSWIKSTSKFDDLPSILEALSVSQSYKKEKKTVTTPSPRIAAIPKKPSAAEFKKLGELSAQHFEDIQREEVLSAKKTWQLFLEQENSKLIKDEHLTAILDVFRGEEVFTFEAMKSIGFEYGRCPVLTAFRTMSDLPIKKEHAQLVHDCEQYIAHVANKEHKKFKMTEVDV